MNPRNLLNLRLIVILPLFVIHLRAEVIDRIAAVVNGRIITASDIRQERILAPAFGDEAKNDDMLLEDLIQRALVEEQITQFPNLEVTDADIDAARRDLRTTPDVTPDALRAAVRSRILRARFFELRFRQFIRATDEDVQKYYDEVFVPEARARGLTSIPALEEAAESIRANIVDEKMSSDVQLWLESIRRRSNVEIFK